MNITSLANKLHIIWKFYEDKELRPKLNEILHFEQDPFAVIREVYEDDNNKDIAIYHITEYVRKYAKSCLCLC